MVGLRLGRPAWSLRGPGAVWFAVRSGALDALFQQLSRQLCRDTCDEHHRPVQQLCLVPRTQESKGGVTGHLGGRVRTYGCGSSELGNTSSGDTETRQRGAIASIAACGSHPGLIV